MAAKVSIQDITDAGFRAEQFGTPDDWEAEGTGYLARVIARARQWARGELGGGFYDAAEDGPVAEHIRYAELCWCSATLWKRRAAFIDSNAVSALGQLAYLDRREFEAQAARAMECAEAAIIAARGDGSFSGSALAVVAVETGPYRRSGAIAGEARR
jgi:hypothetical protein